MKSLLRIQQHIIGKDLNLLWAAGVNGEGSSIVTFQFIECLLSNHDFHDLCIVYTAKSTLSLKLLPLTPVDLERLSLRNIYFVKLPKICRNYFFHFLVKCFLPMDLWFQRCIVFDDFPFRLSSRQLLYFHQPNLIFGVSQLWRIKRLAFVILKTKRLTVNFQTFHIRDSFFRVFGECKSLCLLHQV